MRIDLHTHSTASDGSCTPAQILETAEKLQLGALAITDHDTVSGVAEALKAGIPKGLGFITGVEISAAPPPSLPISGSFHILGYGFNLNHQKLLHTLETLQNARKNRNPQIIARLQQLGIDIRLEDVRCECGPCQLGRPHIAQALVRKKIVASIDEAFDRFLGRGQPAYVDKFRAGHDQAVQIILDAGGLPVLAHPALLNLKNAEVLEELVRELCDIGLEGLEVFYPEHAPSQKAEYRRLAERYGLLMTGGTDFHGAIKPDIQIGIGRGDFYVPFEIYENLINALCRKTR